MTNIEQEKANVINRLKTIKGHISGIEKMIEEDKTCADILLQVAAVKASVHKVGLKILEQKALHGLNECDEDGKLDKEKIESVIRTLLDYSK